MEQNSSASPAPQAPDTGVWYECVRNHEKPKIWLSFSPEVVSRLQREAVTALRSLPGSGREIGGILLGAVSSRAGGEAFRVEVAESIPCDYRQGPAYVLAADERLRLAKAVRLHRDEGKYAVLGLFRSQTRADLQLYEEDLAVLQDCFPEPVPLVLVLTPLESGLCTAGVFLRHEEGWRRQFCDLEIPLFDPSTADLVRLARPEPAAPAREAPPPPQPAEVPEPMFVKGLVAASAAARARRIRFWRVFGIAAIAVSAALLVVLVIYWMPYFRQAWPPALTPAVAPRQRMTLRIANEADRLVLTWNGDSPVFRGAQRGVLDIQDGPQSKEISLDAGELMAGSVVYLPATAEVRFRMEVWQADGHSLAESVRFLSGRGGSEMPAETAAKPARQAAARPPLTRLAAPAPRVPARITAGPPPAQPAPATAPANQ